MSERNARQRKCYVMRRTKIVATLGPATSSADCIAHLIQAGVDVFRLNFSHGTYVDHAERIRLIREEAAKADRAVAILQDLQGPKIRTGLLANSQPVELVAGQQFTITNKEIVGTNERVSTSYTALPIDVRPGDRILLSDGLIELHVRESTETDVICDVITGSMLREHQGINLPGVHVSAPSVTDKDKADLQFGLEHDVDYIAISFVRQAQDVRDVKVLISRAGKETPVIAKLEKPEAIDALDEILSVADGVMVARGDMGVELPLEQVPLIQKRVIEAANECGIPVITATQMLESMVHNPRPTRAESSDVANAIIDGTDAVMLSDETAIGDYPIQAVQTMAEIACAVEESGRYRKADPTLNWPSLNENASMPQAIGAAVAAIVHTMPISAVWVLTQSGSTARLVASHRPVVPIVAFTPSQAVYQRLSLLWGVIPIKIEHADREDESYRQVLPLLEARGLAKTGDAVVLTGGYPFGKYIPTNFLRIMYLIPGHPTAVF